MGESVPLEPERAAFSASVYYFWLWYLFQSSKEDSNEHHTQYRAEGAIHEAECMIRILTTDGAPDDDVAERDPEPATFDGGPQSSPDSLNEKPQQQEKQKSKSKKNKKKWTRYFIHNEILFTRKYRYQFRKRGIMSFFQAGA